MALDSVPVREDYRRSRHPWPEEDEPMKHAKKRRTGIDPLYLIIGGALVLLVILFTLMR